VKPKLLRLLAEHLVASQTLPLLVRDLDAHSLDNQLSPDQNEDQVEESLDLLFQNHPEFLTSEDQREVLQLPEYLQGEALLDRLTANTSNEDA